MAMLYKNKALDINQELFTDYFNLNAIYNYDKIIIINDEELEKVLNQEKILKPLIINDKYPIYTLLNYLNNSSSIYLQKEYGILNQDELKESIKNYSKTIIASKELISYLTKNQEEGADNIWKSEIFGRSLDNIVKEGIQSKLMIIPENTKYKLSQTVTKIVNKGSNNLIAIVL